METLTLLAHGFTVALTPYNLMWCLLGCLLGTMIGVLPGLGPGADHRASPAHHLPGSARGRRSSSSRHLLRRHVRRIHDVDPPQHAGRKRHRRDRARGQPHGPVRARGGGARHLRHRVVRRGNDRHALRRLRRALGGAARPEGRRRRLLLAHGAGLRHGLGGPRVLGHTRAHRPRARASHRDGRDRPADRPAALHLRPARASRRHRRSDRRGGPLRRGRDALHGGAALCGEGRGPPAVADRST